MREKSARRSLCSDCSSVRSTSTEGEHRSHRFASSAFSAPVSSRTSSPSLWLVFRSSRFFSSDRLCDRLTDLAPAKRTPGLVSDLSDLSDRLSPGLKKMRLRANDR